MVSFNPVSCSCSLKSKCGWVFLSLVHVIIIVYSYIHVTLLHPERPKPHRVLAILSAIGLRMIFYWAVWLLTSEVNNKWEHFQGKQLPFLILPSFLVGSTSEFLSTGDLFLAHLYKCTGRAIALSLASALVAALVLDFLAVAKFNKMLKVYLKDFM